jgi:hypothetical protein
MSDALVFVVAVLLGGVVTPIVVSWIAERMGWFK